ncbi:MAG TPA: hypothetical protein VFO19_08200 [Vicinamibacterales bacterium]|nr:hypothetical protein [Vicinamibacterales bacterium]
MYRAILHIACIVLAARYAFDPDASVVGRVVVGAVTIVSLLLPPGLWTEIVSVVSQLAVSLFVLLRAKLAAPPR